jgi:uncharacterized repeat protein (TIGR01451 family)
MAACRYGRLGLIGACVISVLLTASVAFGGPILEIKPITWDVVGLDSNSVATGPDTFPLGARVCNTGDADAGNVTATFHFDAPLNAFFALQGDPPPHPLTLSTLPPGGPASFYDIGPDRPAPVPAHCADFYWNVVLARNSSAYNKTQPYHIEVTADALGIVGTPSNRQLFIEHLISQNRNSVNSISGPATVYVGNTYTYTISAKTATGGYEQVVPTVNFPDTIFRIRDVSATYAVPTAPHNTNTATYADACGWDPDATSGTYRSCIGPANYPGGKAAGNPISTTITVDIIAGGTATVTTLIYDFSGSSYHYNSDFGVGVNSLTITATSAPAGPDLTIAKTHGGTFSRGQVGATYSITVTNDGSADTDGSLVTVTDTLPAGLTATAINGLGWSCSAPPTLTCTRTDVLPATASYDPITVTVDVAANAPGLVTNTATVSGGGDVEPGNNSASDPTTILAPDLVITKTHSATFFRGQFGATYTITVTNTGSAATDGSLVTVTDILPAGLTATGFSGSGWSCTLAPLTCTRTGALAIGASYPAITLTVNVAANAPPSVINTVMVSGGSDADTSNNTATDPTPIVSPSVVGFCPEDAGRTPTKTVDPTLPAAGSNYQTVQAAYDAASNGDIIGLYSQTLENVTLGGSKTLTITKCTTGKVTAANPGQPAWNVTSAGTLLIVGVEGVGGTSAWRIQSGGHDVRGIRGTGASQYGILVLGSGSRISYNEASGNLVGIRVEGNSNDLRGGTVSGNGSDGVQLAGSATSNSFQGATVQQNGGQGILVQGTLNSVHDNRVYSNSLSGIRITGSSNTIMSNLAENNLQHGYSVAASKTRLESNTANKNAGDGFNLSGGTSGANQLKSNQSNQGSAGGARENTGAEYRLLGTIKSLGGNKADNIAVPKTSKPTKCPTFPSTNATVAFAVAAVCE